MKRPVPDIRGLVVHRDGTFVLDRFDWRVQRGGRWGILGANGSGKTSLLHPSRDTASTRNPV